MMMYLILPSNYNVIVCANHPETSLQTLNLRVANIGSVKMGCSYRKTKVSKM